VAACDRFGSLAAHVENRYEIRTCGELLGVQGTEMPDTDDTGPYLPSTFRHPSRHLPACSRAP